MTNQKVSKIKLKVHLKKVKRWKDDEDGEYWFSYYPITQIYNIMRNHYTQESPRIYIRKIKGSEASLKYTVIFETTSNKKEAIDYIAGIFYDDDTCYKGFEILSLK